MFKKPYLIAEVGQAHEGSINMAHNFIREIKNSGANAVKFQCHVAEYESSKHDRFRIKPQFNCYKSRYEYWKKMEFSPEEWNGLYKHCKKIGIDFICSPFSDYAADLISKTGVDVFKIASGEIFNLELFESIKKTKKKIIFSTGLTNLYELEKILSKVEKKKILSILYCVSKYPTPADQINLKSMIMIKNRLKIETGLSDHSGTIFPALAGYLSGGNFFEVHVTFSKKMKNFDSSSSLNLNELKLLKEGLNFLKSMNSSKSSFLNLNKHQIKYRKLFRKNAVLNTNLLAGTKIKKDNIIFLKPKIGIGSDNIRKFIGKKIKKNLNKNHYLKETDFLE